VLRPITGYYLDDVNDWVAELSCGHGQHIRHKPPFLSRPWVTTDEGRASMLGTELDCVRCDRLEVPEGAVAYKRTAEFDEATIPSGLRRNHSTKPGVWGVIHVVAGRLRYHIEGLGGRELVLDPETPGIVVPEVPHHVEPDGPVRFFVEFRRMVDRAV
jgi:tellurite methyltransferase